ncbi:MAG: AraC family transcriptional regulator [Burkholderiaceae bacterium]
MTAVSSHRGDVGLDIAMVRETAMDGGSAISSAGRQVAAPGIAVLITHASPIGLAGLVSTLRRLPGIGDIRMRFAVTDGGIDGDWLPIEYGVKELSKPQRSTEVHRAVNGTPERVAHRGGMAPRQLRSVCDYIEGHLADKVELEALAAVAGLSACHFARAFRQSTGVPPHRYLMLRRIAAGERLVMDTDRPFSQISLDVGFSDQSHFTRTFVRVTGETPRAFRRRHR